MKNFTKFLSIILIFSLFVCVFTACSNSNNNAAKNEENVQAVNNVITDFADAFKASDSEKIAKVFLEDADIDTIKSSLVNYESQSKALEALGISKPNLKELFSKNIKFDVVKDSLKIEESTATAKVEISIPDYSGFTISDKEKLLNQAFKDSNLKPEDLKEADETKTKEFKAYLAQEVFKLAKENSKSTKITFNFTLNKDENNWKISSIVPAEE